MRPQYNKLTEMPIPQGIRHVALPAVVGYFFYTMYNVVDTYFAGHLSTQAMAALSLSFPVFFTILSLGSGLGTGTTALAGNALGAGDEEAARRYAVQGAVFGVLAALALTVVGRAMSPWLFKVLGAGEEGYLSLCLEYMNTIFLGAPFFILIYMANAALQAQGDTRTHRNFLILSFFLNVGLDPWFVYGGLGVPPMGVRGIALATVLIQVVGAGYVGYKAWKSGLLRVRRWRELLPQPQPFLEIAQQGFPASLNFFTIGLGIFVITYFISQFGEAAVAAYGVATRVEQIVLMPSIGLNIATLTMVAQNHGAGLTERVFETRRRALRYGFWIMLAGTVIVFLGAEWMMDAFTEDPQVVAIGREYLRISAFVLYAYVILFVNVAALQGVKKPMFAIWIGLARQVAAPWLVFTVFIELFDMGLLGVWWGVFVVTWAAAIFAMGYAGRLLRRTVASREAAPGRT